MLLGSGVAAASCAQLPAREATAGGPAHVAVDAPLEGVTVRGRGGAAVSAAAEARILAAIRAEGHGELVTHHLAVLAASGEVDLYRGNATRLLVDGPATFAAMKEAIAAARHRVMLEMYIFEDAGIAAEFAEVLRRKAVEGVDVALLYDSVGSLGSDAGFFESMASDGVSVCAFNPLNPLERPGYWSINHRNHRKVLVVDSDVAFTGGINISKVYSSGSFSKGRKSDADALEDGWRDTQIELRGPVVGAMAATFREQWAAQGCEGSLVDAPAPTVADPGRRVVKVLPSDPRDAENRIYRSLLSAVDSSRVSVHLSMAYFAPGPDMVDALADAARRGVDVSLVLPGKSDFSLVLHAGRSYYQTLLESGVRIHEMDHAMMHAKTAVIDGVYSTVGSSNMDWRSFVANSEINVVVLGDDFGSELEALFQRDVASSRRIDAVQWSRRGLKQRLLESVARAAEPLL